MRGLVIKNTGSWYTVKTDDGQLIESKIKGNFRLKGIRSTNPVAVGDYVQLITNQEGTAFISSIEDRQNYIIRKSPNLSKQSHILAANLDRALLVVTVNYPETSTTFIDRFLAGAEAYRVPVIIVFNKCDLLTEEELRYEKMMRTLYETIGYQCVEISAATGEGVDELRPLIRDKKSLLSGNSGVGKSTLINQLIPDAGQRTAEISEAHNSGMHTTTFSEMLELPEGAISLILRVLRASEPLISRRRNSPAISRKFSSFRRTASSPTVPTPTNRAVPSSRLWRSIILLPAAIRAILYARR